MKNFLINFGIFTGIVIILLVIFFKSESIYAKKTYSKYHFALEYTKDMLLSNDKKREEFINRLIKAEARFHQDTIGYNDKSGLTYDGINIDYKTGIVIGVSRNWSAPSKESLHITILSLAIAGDPRACLFISPDDPSAASKKAVKILTKKIKSYEKFNKEYPGFGGFLPWFKASDKGLKPAVFKEKPEWDWSDRVPALDNGQLALALFLASDILKQNKYYKLAKQYQNYWTRLAENSVMIFYDNSCGKIRGETKINNINSIPKQGNYFHDDPYYLISPYEGELMVIFMSLFGNWKDTSEIKKIWHQKYITRVDYPVKDEKGLNHIVKSVLRGIFIIGPKKRITVRKGFWYSSHEMWNFLVLLYQDIEIIKKIFINGEKARTWYSAENNIPGLFSSVNPPINEEEEYYSDLGIPELAEQPVTHQHIIAPYAAFPVILADERIGVVWLHNMLLGSSMQGPYGISESITIDGERIAPLLTWDGKITVTLALIGTSTEKMREALMRAEKYEKFKSLVKEKYEQIFSKKPLKGEDIPFRIPTSEMPINNEDFKEKKYSQVINVLETPKFQGGGNLLASYNMLKGILSFPASFGYIWNPMFRTDIKAYHYVNFKVKSTSKKQGGLFFEIENVHHQKIMKQHRIEFPNTQDKFEMFTIDMAPFIISKDTIAGVFIITDPDTDIQIKQLTLTKKPYKNSQILKFGSRYFSVAVQPLITLKNNLIGRMNFKIGDELQVEYDKTLKMYKNMFYIWGEIPEKIDTKKKPIIALTLKTKNECMLWLELKNTDENFFVGTDRFGIPKILIEIPNTRGEYKNIYIDLRDEYIPDINNKTAKYISFSNPNGDIEIKKMLFIKPKN